MPDFRPEIILKSSKAAARLCNWIRRMVLQRQNTEFAAAVPFSAEIDADDAKFGHNIVDSLGDGRERKQRLKTPKDMQRLMQELSKMKSVLRMKGIMDGESESSENEEVKHANEGILDHAEAMRSALNDDERLRSKKHFQKTSSFSAESSEEESLSDKYSSRKT